MRVDMSQPQTAAPRRTTGLLARVLADKRRYKRLTLNIKGRYMRQDKQEYACELVDLSAGGGAIAAEVRPEPGERIVASFEHIGMLEGTIVRTTPTGFAFRIMATKHKREKLIAQLMWLANRNELDSAEERRHERITPPNSLAMIQFGDSPPMTCRLIDISISGASIASTLRPLLGTDVTLGRLRARVVRHHAQGFGVEFMDLQNAVALRRHFG